MEQAADTHFEIPMAESEHVFKPSPWPVIGSYVGFPLIMGTILSFAVNEIVGALSVIVFFVFFLGAFRPNLFFLRSMNAMGHINSVTLTPEGITHRSSNFWFALGPTKTYTYSWNDIHSIKLHSVSYKLKMVAFTPVTPVVGKFYRSMIDGTYGVPLYGRGSEMLDAMLEYHARYAAAHSPLGER